MGYDSNSIMCVTTWAVPYSTRNYHGLSNDTCDAHEMRVLYSNMFMTPRRIAVFSHHEIIDQCTSYRCTV